MSHTTPSEHTAQVISLICSYCFWLKRKVEFTETFLRKCVACSSLRLKYSGLNRSKSLPLMPWLPAAPCHQPSLAMNHKRPAHRGILPLWVHIVLIMGTSRRGEITFYLATATYYLGVATWYLAAARELCRGKVKYSFLSHPGIPGVTLCFCTGSYAAVGVAAACAAAAGRSFLSAR